MADFSIGDAVGSGFGLMGKRPVSVMAWGLTFLIIGMALVFKKIASAPLETEQQPQLTHSEQPSLAMHQQGMLPEPANAKHALAMTADEVKELVSKNNTQAVNVIRSMLN